MAYLPHTRPGDSSAGSVLSSFSALYSQVLIRRIALLALLFIVELVAISVWLDDDSLSRATGLGWLIGRWGAWTLRFVVLSAILFLVFGWRNAGKSLQRISTRMSETAISRPRLAGHFCAMGAFGLLSAWLYGGSNLGLTGSLTAVCWLAAGVLAIILAVSALVPWELWLEVARATGSAWIYATALGLAACLVGAASRQLWVPAAHVTFVMVQALLRPFFSGVIADPLTDTVGFQNFQVRIAPECSGLEGVGMMLVFGGVWLWLFRREFRFPRALLMIPAGVAVIFLTNAIRLSALILIGRMGAPEVAMGGFHSQAGWIAFNAVAVGFALTVQRLPWLTVRGPGEPPASALSAENPTAAYLAPFLAILGAAMISRAASGGFEWLYPLRFLAAAAVLWRFRKKYASLDWRFGWAAPAAGALVFGMWIGLDWMRSGAVVNGIGTGLAAPPPAVRIAWLAVRCLAAVVTVPIAEELAFRGFLIRRMAAADFEAVDPRKFGLVPVLASSVAFGVLHGDRWLAGIVAGLCYAAAYRWRGRIGDAVAAHAGTNLLLAAWVVATGNWGLW